MYVNTREPGTTEPVEFPSRHGHLVETSSIMLGNFLVRCPVVSCTQGQRGRDKGAPDFKQIWPLVVPALTAVIWILGSEDRPGIAFWLFTSCVS